MSKLQEDAAQLEQLADTALPRELVEQFGSALDGVAQQAAVIVENTGKEAILQQIHAARDELTQYLHGHLEKLAEALRTAAQHIRA